jgi:predicted outer membrane protein
MWFMKKARFFSLLTLVFCAMLITTSSFAQTTSDTVNTGQTNDPMVVDPGTPNDSIAVHPGHTNDPMAVMTDTGFITKNIMDNIMEIQLSKLGRDKGTSPLVKKAAAQMITDHMAILTDLRKLAVNTRNSKPFNSMPNMAPTDMPQGSDFDAKWASAMLTMHEAKIDELEKFAATTRDVGLKLAIGKALPKIRAHKTLLTKIPGVQLKEDPNAVIH